MRPLYRTALVMSISALFGALAYFGYTAWQTYQSLYNKALVRELTVDEIAANKDRIMKVLVAGGISYRDAMRGFWLRYTDANGVEQVMFIDVDALAKKGLSEWQIQGIVDLLKQYKVDSKESLQLVAEENLPPEYRYHNGLYQFDRNGSFLDTKAALEARLRDGTYDADALFKLGYLYEIEAKYKERDELYERACKEFGERCERDVNIIVTGRVVDIDGNPLVATRVSAVSVAGVPSVVTNENGEYSLPVVVRKMERVRIVASKKKYSEGVSSFAVVTSAEKTYTLADIILGSPFTLVTVDTRTSNVKSGDATVSEKGEFIVTSPNITYYIPHDAFVHKDGTKYNGDVVITVYEFTRANAPESLLAVDVLDSNNAGFAGDMMVTYGMTYLQFESPTGEELHILKSYPMRLVQQLAEIDKLRAKDTSTVSMEVDEALAFLTEVSRERKFIIDADFLHDNGLDYFPPYWEFDRLAGVWENVGFNVLSTDGVVEALSYTINDLR